MTAPESRRRRRVATAVGIGVGGAAYFLTLLNFATDPLRTAHPLRYASNFFEYQAEAFLDGHLWVEPGALGIEAFVRDGREYMYFGPFPALIRLPVMFTTDEFNGRLTLLSMAVAFVLLCVVVTRLTWLVRDAIRGEAPVSRFEAVMVAALLAASTGGTVLTFNASLPWAYHEVYAWSVPLVLGSMYWLARVRADPTPRAIGWLFAFCLATILTRTTGGWAVCLTAAAMGLWMYAARSRRSIRAGTAWMVVGAGVVALAAGILYNWVKFQHPYLFPLQDQVWTTLNARRREALEVNGGTITGPQFFWTSLVNYFRPDGIRFVDYFPWVTLPAEPARAYRGAFLDQSYRTGSVTAFMPGLLVLTIVSVPVLFRRSATEPVRCFRAPLVAGVLTTGGVMAYGYVATRYTAEFVPALLLGAAIGAFTLIDVIERRAPALRWVAATGAVAATAFSIVAQMLTGFSSAAMVAGGPGLDRYVALQQRFSGTAQARLVAGADSLPDEARGHTDELYVQGDCDALFLDSGEDTDRWILVERRSVVVRATLDPDFGSALASIAVIGTDPEQQVWLETSTEGEARLVMRLRQQTVQGPWFEVLPPYVIEIGVRDLSGLDYAEVSSTPGGLGGHVPTTDRVGSDRSVPVAIEAHLGDERALRARGVRLSERRGIEPPRCAALRAESANARSR